MNTSIIKMRLDAEYRTAELELMTPHGSPSIEGLDYALKRMGLKTIRTVELMTPKFRVTRTRLAEMDGSDIAPTRVMQVLQVAQSRSSHPRPFSFNRAA
jgi:hypothetical protein